jgi:hypothetical protein
VKSIGAALSKYRDLSHDSVLIPANFDSAIAKCKHLASSSVNTLISLDAHT